MCHHAALVLANKHRYLGSRRATPQNTRVAQCFLSAGSLMSQPRAGQVLEETNKEGGRATAIGVVNLPPDLARSIA